MASERSSRIRLLGSASLRLMAWVVCGAITLAMALSMTACGAQSVRPPTLQPGANDASGSWYLLLPPPRVYSTDRSPAMGGPLASPPLNGRQMRGFISVYSLEQLDTDAPLTRWHRAAEFQSEQDCEAAKAGQLKQLDDPIWVAKEAERRRSRLVDPTYTRDLVAAERCVSALQLPLH